MVFQEDQVTTIKRLLIELTLPNTKYKSLTFLKSLNHYGIKKANKNKVHFNIILGLVQLRKGISML